MVDINQDPSIYVDQYLGNRDKVTEYLRSRVPETRDVAQAAMAAANSAFSDRPTTFGEQLNAIQAGHINKADALLKMAQAAEKQDEYAKLQEAKLAQQKMAAEMALAKLSADIEHKSRLGDLREREIDIKAKNAELSTSGKQLVKLDNGEYAEYDKRTQKFTPLGAKGPAPSGFNVEFGEDGRPTSISMGGGPNAPKPALNKAADKATQARSSFNRLSSVVDTFDPKMLTLKEQAKSAITALDERVGTNVTGPEWKADLAAFTKFKRNIANHVNLLVHDLSGAAVTVQEAERLMRAVANLGDSPTEFVAKLEGEIEQLKMDGDLYDAMLERGQLPAFGPSSKQDRQAFIGLLQKLADKAKAGGTSSVATPSGPKRIKLVPQ